MKGCDSFTQNQQDAYKTFNFFYQPIEHDLKSLQDHQDIIWKSETSLNVLFGQQWILPWDSATDTILLSLSHEH